MIVIAQPRRIRCQLNRLESVPEGAQRLAQWLLESVKARWSREEPQKLQNRK
jgi:hypothetical protein